MRTRILCSLVVFCVSCEVHETRLRAYEFSSDSRMPRALSADDVHLIVERNLRDGERVDSAVALTAAGVGQTVVQVVGLTESNARAFVVDEDGLVLSTQEFWTKERAARQARFGKMTPDLFAAQIELLPDDIVEVELMVHADVPEPMIPFDGTDQHVSIETYEQWSAEHAVSQQKRIALAKARIREVISTHGGIVLQDPRGFPTVRVVISAKLLRSEELHQPDIVWIDRIENSTPELLGYAGRSSMNATESAGGLVGGLCGSSCDGGLVDVGYWEGTESPPLVSGIARNNSRVSTGNTVTGYFFCPKTCSSDADCPDGSGLTRRCQPPTAGGAKICVQDHVTWVAASVGMYGAYNYDASVPQGSDPSPNVAAGVSFASSGAWRTDQRVGNDQTIDGLDFLIAPPSVHSCQTASVPTPYVNRSQAGTPNVANWAGRAFGTFMTAASGNSATSIVACARLRNGLCVGMYDYKTYSDASTHRRTDFGANGNHVGSSFLNDGVVDMGLERPHLLGPGNHLGIPSGLHMPRIDVAPPTSEMRHASYTAGQPAPSILGTSFAAPTVLSVAIQAHQYEGWFSSLAFPVVNKAVLMAATRDANADGAIGKFNTWSQNAPSTDAEDGGGEINIAALKSTLDNNRYFFNDLSDSSFTSCGTGCRKHVVATLNIPQNTRTRVALAWQACMISEGSTPVLTNDLDLALNCGSPLVACGGTMMSATISSELEMLERPSCTLARTCSIEIRLKNGASIQPCGSTTTERVGVSWSFNN